MRRCIYCYTPEGQPHPLHCATERYAHLRMACYGADPQALGALNPTAAPITPTPAAASIVTRYEFRADLTRMLAEHGVHRLTGVRPSTLAQLLVGVLSTLQDIEADRQRGREVRVTPFPPIDPSEC